LVTTNIKNKAAKKRQWGEVIRLDVEDKIDKRLLKILKKVLKINVDLNL